MGIELLQLLPVKFPPVHHPPCSKVKKIRGHQRRLCIISQHIRIIPLRRSDPLPLLNIIQRAQQIAVRRRFLKSLALRRGQHPLLDALDQIRASPFQKQSRILRRLRIPRIRGQSLRAWPQAPVNVILQARSRVNFRQVHITRGHQKPFVDEVQNPPRQARRKIRPEIQRPVLFHPPREIHPWIFLVQRQLDVRIRFVVPQHHVELRLVLLDEIVLERQRFPLVLHHTRLYVRNLPRQRTRLRIHPPRFQKVRPHPAPQRSSLPNVNNLPARILKQIHPGRFRQSTSFFAGFHSPAPARRSSQPPSQSYGQSPPHAAQPTPPLWHRRSACALLGFSSPS